MQTRHTSSQNPGYYIHTAFNILTDDVDLIEKELLNYIANSYKLEPILHKGSRRKSECFVFDPNEMVDIVEDYIERNFSSSVTYENSLHGRMSRYVSRFVVNNYPMRPDSPISREDYRTGNQEIYEMDLGCGIYLDMSSGQEFDRADEDEEF